MDNKCRDEYDDNNCGNDSSFDDKLKAMIAERNKFDDNCWTQQTPRGYFNGNFVEPRLSSIGMNVDDC